MGSLLSNINAKKEYFFIRIQFCHKSYNIPWYLRYQKFLDILSDIGVENVNNQTYKFIDKTCDTGEEEEKTYLYVHSQATYEGLIPIENRKISDKKQEIYVYYVLLNLDLKKK